MSKPFFYRIEAADFFTIANSFKSDKDLGKFIRQFAIDLITKTGNSDYAKQVISEAVDYIEKKKAAGKKGGEQKASSARAVLEQCYPDATSKPVARSSNSNSNRSSNRNNTEEIETLKPLSEYSDDFLKFWSAYPTKTGKGDAWKSWKKARPSFDTVSIALEWQMNSQKWKDGYVPNPSTYINQRRWEDEPPQHCGVVPAGFASKNSNAMLERSAMLRKKEMEAQL